MNTSSTVYHYLLPLKRRSPVVLYQIPKNNLLNFLRKRWIGITHCRSHTMPLLQ